MDKDQGIISSLINTIEQIDEVSHPIVNAIIKFQEELKKVDMNSVLREAYEWIQTFDQAVRTVSEESSLILLDIGWPPPLEVPVGFFSKVIKIYNKYGKDKTEKIVTDSLLNYYNKEVIKKRLESWKKNRWLNKRMSILNASIDAHINGKYELSIPSILPQIEGVMADYNEHKGQFTTGNLKESIKKLLEGKMFKENIRRFIFEIVLVQFEHGNELGSFLSRHAILHGADCDYASPENSLKIILLFDYLQSVMQNPDLFNEGNLKGDGLAGQEIKIVEKESQKS
jgi:hypothetical protein